jgi:hypothetical protein
MSESKIELQNNGDSLEETEPITIACPFCKDGHVRVDSPIARYRGKPVVVSSSKVKILYSAEVLLGRCSQCKKPLPLEPMNIIIRGQHTG